jgi:hypothetical protein
LGDLDPELIDHLIPPSLYRAPQYEVLVFSSQFQAEGTRYFSAQSSKITGCSSVYILLSLKFKRNRARICKHLRSPGIEAKE